VEFEGNILNKTKFMKKTLAIAFAVVAGLSLRADTISYTNSFPSTLTEWSTTLNVPQFNPSLGTLSSIDITLTSGMTSVLHMTNNINTASSGDEASQLKVFVTNPGSYDLFAAGGSPVMNNITSLYHYNLIATAGYGVSSSPLTASGAADTGAITDSSTLALFTGAGTEGLPIYTSTLIFGSHTGNQTQINVTSADLQSVITYDFTAAPVPEPTTFAMIGAGLASLGMVWRRRSSK